MESTPPPPSLLEPPEESPLRTPRKARAVGGSGGVGGVVGRVLAYDEEPAAEAANGAAEETKGGYTGQSMYVTLFDEMISTVLAEEEYLFTAREAWVLRYILNLPYAPHYLLTRLLLRRAGKVFPLNVLVDAYSSEIGEEGVKRAAGDLSVSLDVPRGIADAEAQSSVPSPPAPVSRNGSAQSRPNGRITPWANLPTFLSEEEERKDPELAEALRRSSWAEDHPDVDIDAYLDGLSGKASAGPSDAADISSVSCDITSADEDLDTLDDKPTFDAFTLTPKARDPITTLAHDASELGLDDLMTCVPVEELRKVARSRKIPPSMLQTRAATMLALKDAAKRQTTLDFASYKGKGKARADAPMTTRTSEHLIVAQILPLVGGQVIQIDRELYSLITRVNLIFSRTPPASTTQPALLLPPILVKSHKRHYPDYGPPTRSRIWATREELLIWERAVSWETLVTEAMGDIWSQVRNGGAPSVFAPRGQPMARTECAKIVRKVWEEVWPIWKTMVAEEVPIPDGVIGDRFRTEHVLTRVVYKGAEALGVLHEYVLECEVLRALLAQRRWRRGKRGAWHDRLALVLMNHFKGTAEEVTAYLETATQECIDGLLDEDTHMIYRPGLSKRLTRLENKLNLPPEERHISYAQLLTCETRELVAVRSAQNTGQVRRAESPRREREASLGLDEEAPREIRVGKSAWVGREGEVTVEGWVLEWWEAKGYSGFHAESSILTTLFALLMWPVLFHALPGAFETLYQTAPLDLGEDGFTRARKAIIDERLAQMEDTKTALAMLRETDTRERPRGTWAVGLSWEFGASELEEILECMGGRALATICRMLCEEYRHRSSGVPDLIVWNYVEREARFVEVKGPGDNLSETQRVWIDVLLSAGVPVEVCRVKDKEEEERRAREKQLEKERKAAKKKPRGGRTSSGTSRRTASSESVSLKRKVSGGSARSLAASSRDEPIVIDDSDDEVPKRRKSSHV